MIGKKLRVLVLGGGPSSEREVSIKTAEMVHKYLDREKYEPILATVSRAGQWKTPKAVDVVFIAMHGEFGEDGTIQKIFDGANLPYTGSGAKASALGMDKIRSRALFKLHGMSVPEYFYFSANDYKKNERHILEQIQSKFLFPIVVKPTDRGSSVGVSIVKTVPELSMAVEDVFKVSSNAMAEEFIGGMEFACGVLDDGKNSLTPLLPTEIIPKMGTFFDYKSKYLESGSDEVTPARVPDEILKEAQDIALKTHILVGCSGFSRTDMIWSRDRGKVYTLEINTIPGLTEQSLLPKAAAASGIEFSKLLDRIIQSALV